MRTNLQNNKKPGFTITSSCNGCFEEPPAPTVVHLVVVSSGEVLGHLEVACIHRLPVPSSVVQCTCLSEADRGRVGERMCSAALDAFGEGECETVVATRS